ncbi:MAG: SDR family NAD(P)-dependent oxidoreductase [Myxococcota bacterium]
MSGFADGVDSLLEWSVVGSFTRLGSAARRRMGDWETLEGPRMVGRVVVISGGTSGLGLETARALAAMGATVEIIARNPDKAETRCRELREETGNPAIDYVVADTGDLATVRAAAAELTARHPAIHVLIHNAGALDAERQTSPQGVEQTVASQVVGPFLLTELLSPALRRAAPARVLWVSSGGMYSEPLSVSQLEMPEDSYDGTTAYARAKRAQVTLSEQWNERLAPDGVLVHAMHPGWADTPGVARSLPTFRRVVGPLLRTPADGADTLIWLAASDAAPREQGGLFWHDRRPRPIHRLAKTRRADTPEERQRLWDWCVAKSALV